MQNGWIKLHRKVLDNKIFIKDPNAWRVFEYLLLIVDKETGTRDTGRFQISNALNMNPNTVYASLTRLRNAKMITQVSNNRFTTISILNWHTYQGIDNNKHNNKITTGQQQDNTKQEDKNKELSTMSKDIEQSSEKNENIYTIFNETWKKIYGKNPTGGAIKTQFPVKRLVKSYGIEKVCGVLIWLESNRDTLRFAPVVNSPLDLEQKWNGIINAYKRENQPIEELK